LKGAENSGVSLEVKRAASLWAAVRAHSKIAVAIQLAHAGRKGSSRVPWEGGAQMRPPEGWLTHAPSALSHTQAETLPIALDEAGLERVRRAFFESTRRAARLGIDAIEIHAAHGYLLHQFLSPIANTRTDAYWGELNNRMRFPLQIFEAVREAFPADKPVGVRVSATDWVRGGWDLTQTIAFARELHKRGADWVTASSGGVSPLQKIALGPGYQVPFANSIREAVGINAIAVGLITDARQAEEIVSGGKADFVALARGMLFDPRWGWHAAAQLGGTVNAPPQYWRALPHQHKDLFGDIYHGAR
jgi:NADPH2 dehydrogenase